MSSFYGALYIRHEPVAWLSLVGEENEYIDIINNVNDNLSHFGIILNTAV